MSDAFAKLSLDSIECDGKGVHPLTAIQTGVCQGHVSSVHFSGSGRWYDVRVSAGKITDIQDLPIMDWAL